MIGRIAGRLLVKQPPQIIVDVNGVGYEIDVPMSTLYQLPATGEPVTLFTHAHVFGQKHWDDCLDVKAGEPNSLEILRNLDACLLIVETDTHTDLCRIIRESDNWLVIVDEIPPSHRESETRSERFIAIRK